MPFITDKRPKQMDLKHTPVKKGIAINIIQVKGEVR